MLMKSEALLGMRPAAARPIACFSGAAIERRADPNDRRANRLYLKPAAKPLLARLANLGADMMETVLDGVSLTSVERMLKELGAVKNNLRSAIAANTNQQRAANG